MSAKEFGLLTRPNSAIKLRSDATHVLTLLNGRRSVVVTAKGKFKILKVKVTFILL